MRKSTILKLLIATLCALYACSLPLSLAKPHEISFVAVKPYKALQPVSVPKVQSASQLSPVAVPAAPVAVVGCGNDPYMAYIYRVESDCNTGAVNEIGCRGLGQACPGSKLPCGNDWACQDSFFRQYAVERYGSIYAAYLFRTANNWW